MAEEINPADYPNDADYHEQHPEHSAVVHRRESGQQETTSQKQEQNPTDITKPPVGLRVLRILWRRRRWRIIGGHKGPNWAEGAIVILTIGILVVGYLQYTVYRRQAKLMSDSLNQNERSIILNMGQLAISNRNAKTAEDTLGEMKKGGPDTHQIAEATKSASDTAEGQLKFAQQSLFISQRPYLTLSSAAFVDPHTIRIGLYNSGHTPATNMKVEDWAVFVDTKKANQPGGGKQVFPGGGIIGAEKEITLDFRVMINNPDDAKGLALGTKRLSVEATITYSDIFNESCSTNVCAVWDQVGKIFKSCGTPTLGCVQSPAKQGEH
jgi:hypothetical protein